MTLLLTHELFSIGRMKIDDFSYNIPMQRYEGFLLLDDVKVLITVAASTQDKEASNLLLRSGMTWVFLETEKILDYCASELLETKNEGWLKENESPLTALQFKRKLRLKSVEIVADGSMKLTYLAGGLFWGHDVVVSVMSDFSFDYATLEG
jgi:hypothetical protein